MDNKLNERQMAERYIQLVSSRAQELRQQGEALLKEADQVLAHCRECQAILHPPAEPKTEPKEEKDADPT